MKLNDFLRNLRPWQVQSHEEGLMRDAALPVTLIVLGAAWLLNSLDWLPEVHWLWIVGLAGAGSAILILDGITKSSVVAGPLLILAAILSFARQYYGLGWRFVFPSMLIGAGVLMLAARSPAIPYSRHLSRPAERRDGEGHE
jgi:hypothetical protein